MRCRRNSADCYIDLPGFLTTPAHSGTSPGRRQGARLGVLVAFEEPPPGFLIFVAGEGHQDF
jgi:hypothetical protein